MQSFISLAGVALLMLYLGPDMTAHLSDPHNSLGVLLVFGLLVMASEFAIDE